MTKSLINGRISTAWAMFPTKSYKVHCVSLFCSLVSVVFYLNMCNRYSNSPEHVAVCLKEYSRWKNKQRERSFYFCIAYLWWTLQRVGVWNFSPRESMCCNFPGELSSSCELTLSTLMVEISPVMRVQQFLVNSFEKMLFNSHQLAYCVFITA